jgi:hypothetical protein
VFDHFCAKDDVKRVVRKHETQDAPDDPTMPALAGNLRQQFLADIKGPHIGATLRCGC